MKKVRKGNDIAVSWSIVHEEQDFDLTSLDTTLYLINIFGKQEVKDYKKEGNRISWTFHGKDQKNTGKYSLMLVLNEGSINMHTIDACDFVELTSCSCQVSEGSDNDNVTTEVIELSSVIDYLVVDDQLDADSANPISNAAVTQAINAVGERILDIAVFELHSPALMQEAFEKYNLATNLNTPISCLVKYDFTDSEYQSVFLVVEKYGDAYKLNFIKLNACTKAITDENGEIDEEKTKWNAKGQLIDGICDVYLLKPEGYCKSVGTGTLLLADDKLDSESDRPISNKAICEALNNVKLFEVVSALPAQGDNNKVYLVASISGETENLLTEYIWVNGKWEKLGEFKADVDLSKYAKQSEVGFVKDVNDNIINDTSNTAAVGKKNIIIGGSAFIQGDKNIAIGVNGNIRSKNSILIGSAPSDNDDKLVIGSEGLGELLVVDENNKAYLRGFGYNGNRNGGESSIDNEYRRLIEEIEKKVSADNLATINGQSITEGGNIVIQGGEGGSYDDTEIREELSKKLEGEVVGTTTPTEGSIGGSYDDTEIRQEIAELSEEVSGLSEKIENLPSAESSVFEAIYGVTTHAEVLAAFKEGKHCLCVRDGLIHNLVSVNETGDLLFTCVNNVYVYTLMLKMSNAWYPTLYTIEKASNKVTSLSSASTDTQYPSAKAVYDAIQQSGTPSGDPMHYMFEAVGATYNATDADIPMVGIYGDSYVHKAKHWHLNELGDITNEEMREIYLFANLDNGAKAINKYLSGTETRTNITTWTATWSGRIKDQELFSYADKLITACLRNREHYTDINSSYTFSGCSKLEKVFPTLNGGNTTSFNGMFELCQSLREVRIKSAKVAIKFNASPLISKASILYLIQNSAATSAMVITLHADAYARLAEDADIVAALANKPNVSLASA